MYVCQICGYKTKSLEEYTEHLDYHISSDDYAPGDEKWLAKERDLMDLEQTIKKAMRRRQDD
jgi:hypothetical protein